MTQLIVLSPDNFPIQRDKTYTTDQEAREAFFKWKERFKSQGYYSSPRYGRIDLKYLHEYCSIEEIKQ